MSQHEQPEDRRSNSIRRRVTFKELATLEISKQRAVVISHTSEGNYSIANRIDVVDDNNRSIRLFLRNAIVMNSEQFKQLNSVMNDIAAQME